MRFYSRDGQGNIDGSYANKQPGVAEELLPDNDPDVMAYMGIDLAGKIKSCKSAIDDAMNARLKQGIIWKYNNAGDPQPISVDESIQKLFSYTTTLRGKGRTGSHGGKFRQGNTRFNIDDAGMEELSIFAAEWGFAIQRISFDEYDAVEAMNATQLTDYLANEMAGQINWTIDWSVDPQNNGQGWVNDTILQIP